jgi:hypothetical protein
MAISKTEKPSTTKTATANKSEPKKVAPEKLPTVKVIAAKKASSKKPTVKKASPPSPEALYKMTEVAAYYLAQNHGFTGKPSDYWIAAKAQISALYQ